MTVPIQETNIRTDTILDAFSRYRKQNVIYYGEQNFITFDTYLRGTYEPDSKEKVMVITKGVEYRPDLVAYDFYGIPDPWWKILEVNGMKDIWEFKAGKTIMLPRLL